MLTLATVLVAGAILAVVFTAASSGRPVSELPVSTKLTASAERTASLLMTDLVARAASHTTTPTRKPRPVDTFVWPFYGYSQTRGRAFAGPAMLHPPLRTGWRFNDFALLEFPPVMYHDELFFMNYDGVVTAINKRTGKRIWHRKIGTLAAVSPGLDVRHKLIFVPTLSDSRDARLPGNGRIVALGIAKGRIRWSHPLPAGSESSPLVHGNSVYLGSQDGTVYSFQARSGHVNWMFHAAGAVKGGVGYSSGDIYFGDYASRVYSVNAGDGHEVWATTTAGGGGTFYGSPAIAFGHIYLGNTNHYVYALSKTSGRVLWDTATGSYVYSSPAAANVPGLGPTVYLGSYDGNFYALSASTGAVRWRHASGGPISGSGTVVGHVIYYSPLRVRKTLGLNLRTGRVAFTFPDGAFASVIADRGAIYLVGASTIYELLPKGRR